MRQSEMFPEYDFHIEPAKDGVYNYYVYCGEKLLSGFLALDMACAFIRHRLRGDFFLPYKKAIAIVDDVLNNFRMREDNAFGSNSTRPFA